MTQIQSRISKAASAGGSTDQQGASSWEATLSAFTEDPHLLAFARHFCGAEEGAQQSSEEEVRGVGYGCFVGMVWFMRLSL